MPEIKTSALIDAPADAVWTLLADFGSIARWWPADGGVQIERVECEGDGIGMIRHIYNKGVANCVSERLDLLDPSTRTLVLSIVGTRPRGLTAYVAEGRVAEIDASHCRIDYRALLTTDPGREEQMAKAILFTWELMFRGLGERARVG